MAVTMKVQNDVSWRSDGALICRYFDGNSFRDRSKRKARKAKDRAMESQLNDLVHSQFWSPSSTATGYLEEPVRV
jgi:hypothetical protein